MSHALHHLHQWWLAAQPNPNALPDFRQGLCLCLSWTWRF